ncbi:MAG: phospholipase D-like domain-containing protein [Myxococcaceae bacterium]
MNRLKQVALAAGGTLMGFALVQEVRNRASRKDPITALNDSLQSGVDGVANALFQSTGFEFCEGNRVDWFNDAAIFDGLREGIEGARDSIHVDTYIWKKGRTGEALLQQVVAAARRGVKVRVMVDPIGSENFEDVFCPRLRDARCEVLYFRPPHLKPLKAWGRNHRKLFILDNRVAFTGGFGGGDEWWEWRDANVRMEGPVVRQMQQAFAAHWLEVGGGLLPSHELTRSAPAGGSRSCFVASTDVKGHSNAHWVTSITIAAAQRLLLIAN